MEQIRYNKILVNEISDIQPTDKDAKKRGYVPHHRPTGKMNIISGRKMKQKARSI